ncbi:MAG: tRNA(fMet)-specific endonuclease VapC [Blastocatellia bacterium]
MDTDVVSFVFKEDTRGELYLPHLDGKLTIISFMTLAETDRWAIERNWGVGKRAAMKTFVEQFVISPFNRILCIRWAKAMYSARRNGIPIQTADGWVAATALLHDVPLVTHNKKHYLGVDGLTIISEA